MKKHIITFSLIFIVFSLYANNNTEIYSRVKIGLENRSITELAELGIAIQTAEYKPGIFIISELSASELERIATAGFKYEVLIPDVTEFYQSRNRGIDKDALMQKLRIETKDSDYPTPENFTLGSMGGYHTLSETLEDLDLMHVLYPELINEKAPIGETNSIEGRPIYWVRISNSPNETTDKPKVLYTALLHAREPASMQQMLFQMWYLLENYESDPEIKYLVDNLELYFVPVVNPDGYYFCETTNPNGGSMWRKNRRANGDGSYGVDLNRNFGYMWGYDNTGSSGHPPTNTYRGTAGFSEPETQNIKEFAETYDFTLALNNHTYSDLLIYPWGYENLLTPDSLIFIEYAKLMTRENEYIYGTVYETLMYLANGVSDDWFYGEQDTKDKVFAFTPEAGAPIDGFWPAIDKIIDICAGHVHMNNSLAHLALPYAEITDISDNFIQNIQHEAVIEILNMGQFTPANYTISIEAISDNIIAVGNELVFNDMEVLEKDTAYIYMELDASVNHGDVVEYTIKLDNGMYSWEDTVVKYYGTPEVVFFDPCDDLDNWDNTQWGVCNDIFFSEPGSIADSPGSNYSNSTNSAIILTDPVSLEDAIFAELSFMTRFNIEKDWDYVQVLISTDNQQTWTALEGRYTSTGNANQAPNDPLYHGHNDEWVLEKIDITKYAQSDIWLKFIIVTDSYVVDEGFYFDDLTVKALKTKDDNDDNVNIYDHNINEDLNIFYHTNTGNLIIQIPNQEYNKNINVKLSDISGRIMFSNNYEVKSTLRIPLNDFNPGIYIAIITGDFNISKKVVIIK